jgi:hypothetical protein
LKFLCRLLTHYLLAPCLHVQIDPKWLERLLPGIVALDPDWVNKVVPAVIRAFDPDYLVRLVNAIAPGLSRVNPDLLVALLPLVNTISLETWAKLIELLNMITIPQVGMQSKAIAAEPEAVHWQRTAQLTGGDVAAAAAAAASDGRLRT